MWLWMGLTSTVNVITHVEVVHCMEIRVIYILDGWVPSQGQTNAVSASVRKYGDMGYGGDWSQGSKLKKKVKAMLHLKWE